MKTLLVCVAVVLLLSIPLATYGFPYNSTQLTETLTVLPSLSGGVSAMFMVYHGRWNAMSQVSVSVKDSLSVTQLLNVGVSPVDELSLSCSVFQMPMAGMHTLSLSGTVSLFSATLVETDPTVKLSSSLSSKLPLSPSGTPTLDVDGSLSATMGAHRGSISATASLLPFDVSARASASIRVFEVGTRLGERDATITGTLRIDGSLTPLDWSSCAATLSSRSGTLNVSLSAILRPNQPLSVGLAVSHPLEIF
jgi:hypothetical protein